MVGDDNNKNNDPELKAWMLRIERRLSKLEGKMNAIIIILGGLLGILAAIITKI